MTGIFVGAPRTRTPDPWVVIPHPKLPRRVPTALMRPGMAGAGGHAHRMSRNVDAMLDGVGGGPSRFAAAAGEGGVDGKRGGGGGGDDEEDYVAPLLQRTLRRRGMSDSSIHSTFTTHGGAPEEDQQQPDSPLAPPQSASGLSRREAAWLESGSVLQALSRRVQSFRSGLSVPVAVSEKGGGDGASLSGSEGGGGSSGLGTSPPAGTAPIATASSRRSSRASRNQNAAESPIKTSSSAGFGLLPTLANLVPSGEAAEMARRLRDHEHGDAALLSRSYRPMGGERELM